MEYKLRRFVNDYLQPPKTRQKMQIGLKRFEEIKQDIKRISARNPHELMRAAEVSLFEIVQKWQQELHCLEKKAAGDCTTIEQISLKK